MSGIVTSPVAVRAMSRALVAKEAVDSLAASHETLLAACEAALKALEEVRRSNPGADEDDPEGASEWLGAVVAVESYCGDALRAAVRLAKAKDR
jgi:hypothetical protein